MIKRQLQRVLVAAFSLSLFMGALVGYLPQQAQAAAINPSDIISDSVFENTNSMSAGAIDAFIMNGWSTTSCIGQNHFTTPDPLGYSSTANAYQFGGNVTAGQAIYDIAQNYHVNPQVILTTLQKEQSIVSGGAGCYPNTPNPAAAVSSPCGSARAPCTQACPYGGGCMTIAMSYACPNDCYAGIEGFSQQLSGGTWLLRFSEERAYGLLSGYPGYDTGDDAYTYSGPMTPGFRQRVAGGANTYYDGSWTTSDGTSVQITNGATASLYTYTPFVSGNQSFVNIFQNTFGFGSTTSGGCVGNETQLPYVVRYYDPKTYDHFYTAYSCDQDFLTSLGYVVEGPVFNDTACTNADAVPVYRYYNPGTGMHMWSTSNETQAQLNADGTGYDVEAGVVFCVENIPNTNTVSRFYNPKTGLHMWAANPVQSDINNLAIAGYTVDEGQVYNTQ